MRATEKSRRALDAAGRVLARDDSSGPQGLPKLKAPAGTHALWVAALLDDASSERSSSRVNVYVNDALTDRDGDGLGRKLERALGTCDAPDDRGCVGSRLADYYKEVRHATRDTDRDGLTDSDELLGVPGKPRLDLPRYGADPRHKDVELLSYQQIGERRFAGWSMGQVNLSKLNPGLLLKYSATAALDPFAVSGEVSLALLDELAATASIVGQA